MKTVSYKSLIESTTPCEYVKQATENCKLKADQYFILVVEENDYTKAEYSPHVKGIEPYSHAFLVGVEKTSGENGFYASKHFLKRKKGTRGSTHVVAIKKINLSKFCIL